MPQFPRSPYDLTGGLCYFARMLDKIRLLSRGELPEDYHKNLGGGSDGRMCHYLNVDYAKLREQVLQGANDEQALEWCYANGRRFTEIDLMIWNGFARKRGWRDDDGGTDFLNKSKANSGLGGRDDILTMFDYYEADEKRRP